MAANPTVVTANAVSINSGGASSGSVNITLTGNANRRLFLFNGSKDNTDPNDNGVSTIVFDAAGVNLSLANGKIKRIGTDQLAIESPYSSVGELFEILEADLPGAGTYQIDAATTGSCQRFLWCFVEVYGADQGALDATAETSETANVSGGTQHSDSITTVGNNATVLAFWGLSLTGNSTTTVTTTQNEIIDISGSNGALYCSWVEKVTAGAQAMDFTSTTSISRHCSKLVSIVAPAAGGVTVTPGNAAVAGSAQGPTVVKGSLALTPGNASVASSVVAPTVIAGSLILAPANAPVAASAIDPAVVITGGGVSVTPAQAEVATSAPGPTVVKGSLTIVAAQAEAIAQALAPNVVQGSLTLVPAQAGATAGAADPGVVMSGLVLTPEAAQIIAAAITPGVVMGSVGITVDSADAATSAFIGNIIAGVPDFLPPDMALYTIMDNATIHLAAANLQDMLAEQASRSDFDITDLTVLREEIHKSAVIDGSTIYLIDKLED